MYPKRMKWTETHVMSVDLDRVISRLQEQRLVQKVDIKKRQQTAQRGFAEIKSRVERWLEFLEDLERPTKGLLASISQQPVKKMSIEDSELEKSAKQFVRSMEKDTKPVEEKLRRISDDISRIEELSGRFRQLSGLNINLRAMNSITLSRVRVGITRNFGELKKAMEKAGANIDSSLLDKREGTHAVMIVYTKGQSSEVESSLRGRIFTEISLDVGEIMKFLRRIGVKEEVLGSSGNILPELDRAMERKKREEDKLRENGADLADGYLDKLRAYEEALSIRESKENFATSLNRTDYTALITGWVEADRIGEMESILRDECGKYFSLSARAPTDEEVEENKVPIRQSNGWLGSLFEPMTNTFSPPRYNEIDPSIWISVPFILFFGIMLGDAGYGLILLLASAYVLKRINTSEFLKNASKMGVLMGITTIAAGIWMGSFFGDLIPRVILGDPEQPLYSLTILGIQFPYDTLRNPMVLFQISLVLGIVQLNLGLFLLGYDRFHKKDYFGVLKGSLSWLLIQAGAAIFLASFIGGLFELSGPLSIATLAMFLIGALLLIFESKGMFFFDMEGYLGDWISYTRILALGLSTFGLAMTFNIIGVMLFDIGGAAMAVIVVPLLIVLHIFNLLLQSLGSAVHSLRLQFVEFFGRFYEGGGNLFDPFGRERIYTTGGRESGPRGERR